MNLLNFSKKSTMKGFSLLELLLSIGIIALIILMATRYFTTARNAQLSGAAVQQIQGIRAAVSGMLADGVTPANINIAALCQAGSIPKADCDTSNHLVTPWKNTGTQNSDVNADPTTLPNANDLFALVYYFPSQQACQAVKNSFTKDLDAANSDCGASGMGGFVFLK